jgi:hypothetical protein
MVAVALFLIGCALLAAPPSGQRRVRREPSRLQLTLGPTQAEQYLATRREPSVPGDDGSPLFDFEAELAKADETSGGMAETFQPHGSLVRSTVQEVNAHELLRRERFGIHGSVCVGADSEGGWGTSVELHKEIAPDLTMGLGVSSVSIDGDFRRGWDVSLAWRKQLTPDFLLELGISVGRCDYRGVWE